MASAIRCVLHTWTHRHHGRMMVTSYLLTFAFIVLAGRASAGPKVTMSAGRTSVVQSLAGAECCRCARPSPWSRGRGAEVTAKGPTARDRRARMIAVTIIAVARRPVWWRRAAAQRDAAGRSRRRPGRACSHLRGPAHGPRFRPAADALAGIVRYAGRTGWLAEGLDLIPTTGACGADLRRWRQRRRGPLDPGHLRRDRRPAIVILTGNFVVTSTASARSIGAAGFWIGDHTITHPYLTQLSDTAVRHEILGGAQQIISVTGRNPAPLFRFPFGDADARTIAIVNRAGYVPVRWTVDTLGWQGTARHSSVTMVVPGCWPRPGRRDRPHARRIQPRRSHCLRRRRAPPGDQRLRAQGYPSSPSTPH